MSSEPVGNVLEMVETRFDEGLLGISSDPSGPAVAIFAGTAFVILLLFYLVGAERYRRPRDPKRGWSSPLPGEPSGTKSRPRLHGDAARREGKARERPHERALCGCLERTSTANSGGAAPGRCFGGFLEGFVEASSLAESVFLRDYEVLGTPRRTPTNVLRRPYPLFLFIDRVAFCN
jgi:hypothetical protein